MSKYGSGQLKHCGGGMDPSKSAPGSLLGKHRSSGNGKDTAKAPAPNSGQTATSKGGRGKGSNSLKE